MEVPKTILHVLAFIGTIVTLTIAGRVLDFLSFHFSTPAQPLSAYKRRGPKPTYALITGASGGIGYGIARSLVQNGFGVILLGHKEAELAEAATQLRALVPEGHRGGNQDGRVDAEAEEFVKTIVMDAQTATPAEMEAKLLAAVVEPELRVSVLVNNVGSSPIALPPFRELRTYSPGDIDGVIDLNARFMARLTTLMLPVLVHRGSGVNERGMSFGTHRRSLIVNVSSAGYIGTPWLIMYGATKAFNLGFSRGLSMELEANPETRHVDCVCVIPGDVRSQGNCMGVSKGAPDSDTFGRYVVERVDGAVYRGWREMRPYWRHHLEGMLVNLVPERLVTQGITDLLVAKRDAWNAVLSKPKDE